MKVTIRHRVVVELYFDKKIFLKRHPELEITHNRHPEMEVVLPVSRKDVVRIIEIYDACGLKEVEVETVIADTFEFRAERKRAADPHHSFLDIS